MVIPTALETARLFHTPSLGLGQSLCPGSIHMRRRWIAFGRELGDTLPEFVRQASRAAYGGSMGEGVDEGLQLIDSLRQIVGGIEHISPGRLGAFDAGRCDRLPHWELTLPAFQVGHIQPGSTPRA